MLIESRQSCFMVLGNLAWSICTGWYLLRYVLEMGYGLAEKKDASLESGIRRDKFGAGSPRL